MDYAIDQLERAKRNLNREIKDNSLMVKDMNNASAKLKNVSELQKAIKILKMKKK